MLPISVLEDETILSAGRLPQTDSEIVIALSVDRVENVDDYLNKIFYEGYYYDESSSDQPTYTIVGIVDVANIYMDLSNSYGGAYVLFNDDAFTSKSYQAYFNYIYESTFVGVDTESNDVISSIGIGSYQIMVDETVPDNMIIMPEYFYEISCESATFCEATGTLSYSDFYQDTEIQDFTIRYGLYNNTQNYDYKSQFLRVNSDTLANMVYDDIYQVSVIANTDLGVNTLVNDISRIDKTILTAKYKVFYPYDSNTSDDFTGLLILLQTIGMIALLVVTVTGSTLITYVIFKAIINTKLHDYAIFRTIGANQNMIQYFIYLENLFVVLVSFVLFLGLSIFLNTQSNVGGIFYSLKGYTFIDYVVLFVLQLVMSLIISRKYCRRIFKESVNRVLKAE